jgi:hypothetical protein
MSDREELLRRAYAAFNCRDIDAALATMRPDVDWPNGMEGGRVSGHEAIRGYWTRQWGMIDPHVEPLRFTQESDQTIVQVRQVVRDPSGSLLLDEVVQHIYTIAGGLIVAMDIRGTGRPMIESTK